MALIARIIDAKTNQVSQIRLDGSAPVRIKAARASRVVIVDEQTGEVVKDVNIKHVGDDIELTASHGGDRNVLILEDADGQGIAVADQSGATLSEGAVSTPGFEGTFVVGDLAQEAVSGLLLAGLGAVAAGGAAVALNGGGGDKTPPTITGPSNGPGAANSAISVAENQTGVTTLTANETVTWSIAGGADRAKFTIDGNTGTLRFVGAPDYENPTDAGTNNTYEIQVRAIDVAGNISTQTVTVTVTDVDEIPPVTGPIDITAGTDSGSNDTLTNNGNPVLTFTGEAGLTITLKGASGALLDPSQYTVSYADGTYTVTLVDADTTRSGNQPFGTFSGGADSGNPASSDDGIYTIVARDAAGNTADVGTFEIDTTLPMAIGALDMTDATDTGASQSDERTSNGNPVLTFTGEAGLTITLKGANDTTLDPSQYTVSYADGTYTVTLVDADTTRSGNQPFGTFSSGADSGNPASSDDGTYTIVASDPAGNSVDVGTFVIDTTPPVTGALDMTDATDTGASQSDERTSNGNPVLTFTGEAGLTITLKGANNTTLDPSQYTVSYADGTYTVTLVDADTTRGGNQPFGTFNGGVDSGNPAATDDGTYTIVASDTAGNSADVGTFVIDTTAPAAPVVTNVTELPSDPNASDLISNDNTQVLTVTGETGGTLKVYTLAGTLIPTSNYTVTETSGTYTVNFSTNTLADGNYVVKLTDAAGNESNASGQFTIDTTAPAAPVVTNVTELPSDPTPSDLISNDNTQVLTVTGEAGGTLRVYTLAGTLIPTSNYTVTETSGTYTVNFSTNTLADGNYVVKLSDVAGNESTASNQFTIDTTAPAAPVVTNVTELPSDPNASDLISNDNTQVLTVTGATGGTLKVYTLAGTLIPTSNYTVTETSGTYTVNFATNTLADGNYVVKLTDTTGNESTASNQFTIDTTAPAAPVVTNVTELPSDPNASDLISNDNTQVLTVTGETGGTLKVYTLAGTLIPTSNYTVTETSGTYTVNFSTNTLADGNYVVKLTDAAGNESNASGQFTIDTTAPAAPVVTNVTELPSDPTPSDLISNDNTQVLTVTGEAGGTLRVYTLAGTLIPTSNYTVTETSGTYTVNFSTNTLADGNYVVKLSDVAGNESTASNQFTIDTTAPSAPVVTNVTELAGDPNTSDLISNDNTQVLTVTGETGSTLKVYTLAGTLIPTSNYTVTETSGTYTVNFSTNVLADGNYVVKLTDVAGNESNASGQFTIDTTAPSAPLITNVTELAGDANTSDLISNDNTQVLTVTGETGGTIKVYTAAGVLIPTSNYTVTESSGTYTVDFAANVLADGNYVVKLSDVAGNESAASNQFTIETAVRVISASYYNDLGYFDPASSSINGALLVGFSGSVSSASRDIDPTKMNWDFDGGSTPGELAIAANEVTGQASGVPSQLLFVLTNGQNLQSTLESNGNFAGSTGDTLDFAAGLSVYGTSTPTVASPDIVVQYFWKIVETADFGNWNGSISQDFNGGSLADTIVGSANANSITGAGGADTLNGLAGIDTYNYPTATDSFIDLTTSVVDYDQVTVGTGDIFNFSRAIAALTNDAAGVALPTGETNLLAALNTAFSGTDAGIVTFTTGEAFLIVDQNQDGNVTSVDTVIELMTYAGHTASIVGGDVVIG